MLCRVCFRFIVFLRVLLYVYVTVVSVAYRCRLLLPYLYNVGYICCLLQRLASNWWWRRYWWMIGSAWDASPTAWEREMDPECADWVRLDRDVGSTGNKRNRHTRTCDRFIAIGQHRTSRLYGAEDDCICARVYSELSTAQFRLLCASRWAWKTNIENSHDVMASAFSQQVTNERSCTN